MVQTLLLEHTHTPCTNRSGVSVECHHQRMLPVALMDGVFLNLVHLQHYVHLQHNSIKTAAWRNLPQLWHQPSQNGHLDCANFASLFCCLSLSLSSLTSCAGLIVRAMLLWPCGVICEVIEFDSCYSGSEVGARVPTAAPGQLREGSREGNLSFLYYSVCWGVKSEPPSCPLSPSCWCLKLIGGVGSFTRLGSLWVWSKEQLELATGRSVCDAAQGGCQWENLSVGKTSALMFISLSYVIRANCMFTCL